MNPHTQLTLSLEESARLRDCETVIENGFQTFVEVGNALFEIRDSKLYRQTHSTFETYCRERWQMVASRARQLIGAAEIAVNLQSVTTVTPTSERQVRPLAKLEPEQQKEAWQMATSINPHPTAELVSEVVGTVTLQPSNEPQPNNGTPTRTGKMPLERAATQQEMDELLVITRLKKFLRELFKVVPAERSLPIILKYLEYKFGIVDEPEDSEEDGNKYCEVGWLLLTTERDMAKLALTPKNAEWKRSALRVLRVVKNQKNTRLLTLAASLQAAWFRLNIRTTDRQPNAVPAAT
jgi:hypothetical protein